MRLLSLLLLAVGLSAHAATFTVTNLQDAATNPPTGSLRAQLAAAASALGEDDILFDPAIQGGTILLADQLLAADAVGVTVDGGPLGMTLDGGADGHRLIRVEPGKTLTLKRLNLTGGRDEAGPTLLSGLSGVGGGAILNRGFLRLEACALYGNQSDGFGGAISNLSPGVLTLRMISCTVASNQSATSGGGLFINVDSSTWLTHCTLSANTALSGGGIGTAFETDPEEVTLKLENCIVAGNTLLAPPPGLNPQILGTDMEMPNLGTAQVNRTATTPSTSYIDPRTFLFVTTPGGTTVATITITDLAGIELIGNNLVPERGDPEGRYRWLGGAAANNPWLNPLGNYGGPTKTMPPTYVFISFVPVPGPAVDQAGAIENPPLVDQRGFPRVLNGRADIGAAEYDSVSDFVGSPLKGSYVTTLADELDPPGVEGAGVSLREAIRDAPVVPTYGAYVMFDPRLFSPAEPGQITLQQSLGPILVDKHVVLNAGATPAGVTLDGGSNHRLIQVMPTGKLEAVAMTLRNGSAIQGGAVYNEGELKLTRCTLHANQAHNTGGAIEHLGSRLDLITCTLTGNQTANPLGDGGGAIRCVSGTATLTHCTVSANTSASAVGGGGIRVAGGELTLAHSIVAGNTVSPNADLSRSAGTVSATGNNLIGSNASVESTFPAGGPLVGTAASPLNAQLSALANNGGRIWTMAIADTSPAMGQAFGSTAVFDQRESRIVGTPDLGAYETRINNALRVISLADSGSGSLRAALIQAAFLPGPDEIYFDPSLSGRTLFPATPIPVSDSAGVLLDASNLPEGLILDGRRQNRIFEVSAGAQVTLRGLTLQNGRATGQNGGALLNNGGNVTLDRCTLRDNFATSAGGAIYNPGGTLTLEQCTLSRNTGGDGGAIAAFHGTLNLRHCTVFQNTANFSGGGIHIYDTGGGGALSLSLANCILWGNTASSQAASDLNMMNSNASIHFTGTNVIGVSNISTGSGSLQGDPYLSPLGDNGGPTQTVALRQGSPAINAAGVISSPPNIDQRGFSRPRGSAPDIGAFEAQELPESGGQSAQAGGFAPFALSALAGVQSGSSTNYAPTVGFNFAGGINGSATAAGGLLAAGDYAGTPEFAQPNWNNLLTASDGNNDGSAPQAQSKLDSAGADLAGLKLWWRAPNTWAITSPNALPANPTANQKLLNGYLDSNDNGDGSTATNLRGTPRAQPYFAVAGLPAHLILGGYKVLVYADGGGTVGWKAAYWLNSNRGQDPRDVAGEVELTERVYLSDTGNTNDFARARGNSEATATPGANYVQFDGRTESAFTVRAEELPTRAVINAVQIVRNPLVIVNTREDELNDIGIPGAGTSLREALRDAPPGGGVVFDPNVFNGELPDSNTIQLKPWLGSLAIAQDVTVDASNIPGGIILDAVGASNSVVKVLADREVDISPGTGTIATQSTDLNASTLPASHALDQRLDTYTHTASSDPAPTWTADLQREVMLSRIVLHNRQDCCGARLSDINVRVLGVNDVELFAFYGLNGANAQNSPASLEVNIGYNVPARKIVVSRFASIGMADPGILSLGEVKVYAANEAVLRGLTLRGGAAPRGGGVLNAARLRMENCTVEFNRATGHGGGIANDGKLELRSCTIANNTATANGGGLHNTSQLAIDHCTVTGNRAEGSGGALYSDAPSVELTHCTVTGNSAGTSAGGLRVIGLGLAAWDGGGPGGGIALAAAPAPGVSAALAYSIVRGNGTGTLANLAPNDILNANATLQYLGTNIVGVVQNSGVVSGPAPLNVEPLLGPLQDYGGPTRTMALRPGSPARNQGGGSYALTDQRGYPVVLTPDLGAYETGITTSNFFAWVWETLPADTPAERMDPYADYDGDNASNADEFFMKTDPRSPASVHEVAELVREAGGGIQFVFATQSGLRYQLQRTTGLDSSGFNLWSNVGVPLNGTGSPLSFTLTPELLATFGDGGIFRVTILFQ